jgi:hypothetical protein
MNQFGPQEEERLLSCLGRSVSLVSDGHSPDSAIAKAASEAGLHPDSVPLAVQTYNVGRLTHQREKCAGKGTSCLLDSFPIARVENVRGIMYPEKEAIQHACKAAAYVGISDEYSSPPTIVDSFDMELREKSAREQLPYDTNVAIEVKPNEFDILRMCQLKQAASRHLHNLDIALQSSRHELEDKLAMLRGWCRRNLTKVAEAEFNSNYLFGDEAGMVFEHATDGLTIARDKAASVPRLSNPVQKSQAPYSLVKAAIDQLHAYACDLDAIEAARTKIASEVAKFFPFEGSEDRPSWILANPSSSSPKEAGLMSSMLNGVAGGATYAQAGKSIAPKPPEDAIGGMQDELSDPLHQAELKQMQAKAMLADMIHNDTVLSSYNPAEVTDAYNEIVQLSPHLATQSAVIRPLLRKRLTGGLIEPFDAEQLTKIDSALNSQRGGLSPAHIPTAA